MEVAALFILIIVLLVIGVPIAVALGLSSIMFLLVLSDTSLASIAQSFFQAMAGHYTLLAIPFFILASTFMSTGGVAKRIIRFSIAIVGHFPGGLAIAGVFACMMFAALSGSSPATVVAIGSIVIAGMRQVGYSKDFAAGVIANAGTLGILIPPSIVMVVYASATDVSVGRMFLAGVIPGLLAGTMLMIAIYVIARVKNLPKGDWNPLLSPVTFSTPDIFYVQKLFKDFNKVVFFIIYFFYIFFFNPFIFINSGKIFISFFN
jgi:C4-dicarboxylate transporter DctM subunit